MHLSVDSDNLLTELNYPADSFLQYPTRPRFN